MTKLEIAIEYIHKNHIDWTKVTLWDIAEKTQCSWAMASRAIIAAHGKPLEVLRREAIKSKVQKLGKSMSSQEICKLLGISKNFHYTLRRELGLSYGRGGARHFEYEKTLKSK
jgi:hypothetical protein